MNNNINTNDFPKVTVGKKKQIESKAVPLYPQVAEREYQRVTDAYLKIFKDCLMDGLPELRKEYKRCMDDGVRTDGIDDLIPAIDRIFTNIAVEMERRIANFPLNKKIEAVSETEKRIAIRQWKNVVKKTFAVNIYEDYYDSNFYGDTIKLWVSENVNLIKSLPRDNLVRMKNIIKSGFRNGLTLTEMSKEISRQYGMGKRSARLLARDQLSTLNAQITKKQQDDAGVSKYKWSTSNDERVRPCHAELDGNIISWDDPPEMWYDTKEGRVYTGRKCHPGEDYLCRCVAIPVFERDTVKLPLMPEDE